MLLDATHEPYPNHLETAIVEHLASRVDPDEHKAAAERLEPLDVFHARIVEHTGGSPAGTRTQLARHATRLARAQALSARLAGKPAAAPAVDSQAIDRILLKGHSSPGGIAKLARAMADAITLDEAELKSRRAALDAIEPSHALLRPVFERIEILSHRIPIRRRARDAFERDLAAALETAIDDPSAIAMALSEARALDGRSPAPDDAAPRRQLGDLSAKLDTLKATGAVTGPMFALLEREHGEVTRQLEQLHRRHRDGYLAAGLAEVTRARGGDIEALATISAECGRCPKAFPVGFAERINAACYFAVTNQAADVWARCLEFMGTRQSRDF